MLSNETFDSDAVFSRLPGEVRAWVSSLQWNERRYVLSLCHVLCAAPPSVQAEFLDEYTADGLVFRLLDDYDTQRKVERHLQFFRIETTLTEKLLRKYIRQFYIHCAQDLHRQPEQYLQIAVKLMSSSEESNNAFNYTLGFELLKMMFQMSWMQQERLYRLQKNQEEFMRIYIKPIQTAHRINGIIVPRDKNKFFARRDYYIQIPDIPTRKLVELVMATFPAKQVTDFGFSVIRHTNALQFNYSYIYASDGEDILGSSD
jgi:hypothetical protein